MPLDIPAHLHVKVGEDVWPEELIDRRQLRIKVVAEANRFDGP